MSELLLSAAWEKQDNEDIEIYTARVAIQHEAWWQLTRKRGQCYMVKFRDNDIRPMWEDDIDIEYIRKEIMSPSNMPLDCPLCQPYDHFNISINQYDNRRYLTKIVQPKYPEGFIDKEGVWAKCPCRKKGEDRKYLKFKGMMK
jgi:hypothetical protein